VERWSIPARRDRYLYFRPFPDENANESLTLRQKESSPYRAGFLFDGRWDLNLSIRQSGGMSPSTASCTFGKSKGFSHLSGAITLFALWKIILDKSRVGLAERYQQSMYGWT